MRPDTQQRVGRLCGPSEDLCPEESSWEHRVWELLSRDAERTFSTSSWFLRYRACFSSIHFMSLKMELNWRN